MIINPIGEVYRRYKLGKQLIDWFAPMDHQMEAWLCTRKVQLYEGSNRSGKTETLIAKIIQIMRGKHPTIKRKIPVKARVVATVLRHGALGVLTNKIRKLMPEAELKGGSFDHGYNGEKMIFTMKNGSTLQLMADTQDVQYHRGEDLDICGVDEECREEIFDENYTRLADRNGLMFLSMTAHNGLTWSFKKIVKRSRFDKTIGYFHFSVADNYMFNREEHIRDSAKRFSEREFKVRIEGKRIAMEGLVYPTFDESTHLVNPFKLPEGTQLFLGVDYGLNNPHAGSMRAILPPGQMIHGTNHFIVGEYYETGLTVAENGTKMGKWAATNWPNLKINYVANDPRSGGQRSKQTNRRNVDEFRVAFWEAYGKKVPMRLGRQDKGCVEYRINILNEEFLPNINSEIKLKVFSNCFQHLNEFESYFYPKKRDGDMNQPTKPKESMNHLMNAAEYVAETRPRHFVVKKAIYDPWSNTSVGDSVSDYQTTIY